MFATLAIARDLPERTGASISKLVTALRPLRSATSQMVSWSHHDMAPAVWVGDPQGCFRYPMANVVIIGTYDPSNPEPTPTTSEAP